MNAAERRHVDKVAALPCVVCLKAGWSGRPVEVHHIAAGSSHRSEFAVAPLCVEHHRGTTGLHGMGVKAFCARYRVPWEKEEGLLVWVNEALAQRG